MNRFALVLRQLLFLFQTLLKNKQKQEIMNTVIPSTFEHNDHLFTHIRQNIDAFEVRPHKTDDFKKAAVTLTIVESGYGPDVYGITPFGTWSNEAAIVLTRRSHKLKHHPGQWALPGGRIEAGESPEETALRELEEEVGLSVDHENVMGRLDDFTTRSGFVVTPIVVWGGAKSRLKPNPEEVASIHRIPFSELMRPDAPILENTTGSHHPMLLMPIGHSWIAAPTAAFLFQFREVGIQGRFTRVAHYEQPFFAWK